MSIDFEELKLELKQISKWPSRLDHRLRLYEDENYVREFIIKSPERIAALIEEVELSERARKSWAEEAQLQTKNRDYQQERREKAEEALHQAEERLQSISTELEVLRRRYWNLVDENESLKEKLKEKDYNRIG